MQLRKFASSLFTLPLLSFISLAEQNLATAQLIPDDSLGTERSIITPNLEIRGIPSDLIEGGATRGNNLFHSFQELNVGEGRGVYFTNPAAIENILTRVTGTQSSNILGTLGVLGNANLFLINPNGIFFGPNARLDVGGSFFASTANSLVFGNGFEFSALNPQAPPLLTVNIPIGLRFRENPANLSSQSIGIIDFETQTGLGGLQVPKGENLVLAGGNVEIDGGLLSAPSGRIELGGLTAAGTITVNADGSLTFPNNVPRGDVFIQNFSDISVIGDGGGTLAINARNLEISALSNLYAGIAPGLGSPSTQAGNIEISALENIFITNSGIFNSVEPGAVGNGGDIDITTGSLFLSDDARLTASTRGNGGAGSVRIKATDTVSFANDSGAFSTVEQNAIGKGGDVEITARSLLVESGGSLNANIFGRGNAGNITIKAADTVSFEGVGSNNISSQARSAVEQGATGNGGNIQIEARSLSVSNGANLNTSTHSVEPGNAGNITIKADTVTFDGVGSNNIFSQARSSLEQGAQGNGGNIQIEATSLSVTNGAFLGASTFGQGNAGNIILKADTVSFDNASSAYSQVLENAVGNGGSIEITASSFSVINGAQLNTSVFGQGNAGNVTIKANTVSFDNASSAYSQVLKNAAGNGGDIEITASSLSVRNGTQLNTSVFAQGNAGNITIKADTVTFDGVGSNGISSQARSSLEQGAQGNGGNIEIEANSLSVTNGAFLGASTFGQGEAGSVKINADTVTFDGIGSNGERSSAFSAVEQGGTGIGGSLEIVTRILSVTNGAQLNASTFGEGNAGSVKINADTVTIDGVGSNQFSSVAGSEVAEGAVGSGGNVEIVTRILSLTNGGRLSAGTFGEGNAGSVKINADAITFDGVGGNGISSGVVSVVGVEAKGNSGDIDVKTRSLSATNGAQLNASTFGEGNAGSVKINADAVTIDGVGNNEFSSSVGSEVGKGAVGNGGNIEIEANSLSVTNGAFLGASTFGQGEAGSVKINADTVTFDGIGSNGERSSAFSAVEQGGTGIGGSLEIVTRILSVTNGAQLNASTFGEGNAGSVKINADTVTIDGVGSNQFSSVAGSEVAEGAVGSGGNVEIVTRILSLTNGGRLSAGTFGEGNAGSVKINADAITFDGVGGNGRASGVGSVVGVEAKGNGGDIDIKTRSLSFTNGAQLDASTGGQGNAGSIRMNADLISIDGVGRDGFPSAAVSEVSQDAIGNGGVIHIQTRELSITNRAALSAINSGSGTAGNISVEADSIFLENQAKITADTAGGQGNIFLRTRDLMLRDNSEISTNAEGTATGGNIEIRTEILTALENSDIKANAQDAFGGRVTIDARGIFGTRFRLKETPQSDITATSQLGSEFSGTVELNTGVDPAQSLVELPQTVTDPNALIAQTPCNQQRQSGFTITGRDGLPPGPNQPLTGERDQVDLVAPTTPTNPSIPPHSSSTPQQSSDISSLTITPARGWLRNEKGEVILVGYDTTGRGNPRPTLNPLNCRPGSGRQ